MIFRYFVGLADLRHELFIGYWKYTFGGFGYVGIACDASYVDYRETRFCILFDAFKPFHQQYLFNN